MTVTSDGPLTVDDVRALLDACATRSSSGIRARALIAVLFHGLKLSQALALTPADFNGEQLLVRDRRPRTMPLSVNASDALRRWIKRRASLGLPRSAPIFSTYQGEPLSPAYVRQLLPRLGRRAGIARRVHAEGLRRVSAPPCLCAPSAG